MKKKDYLISWKELKQVFDKSIFDKSILERLSSMTHGYASGRLLYESSMLGSKEVFNLDRNLLINKGD